MQQDDTFSDFTHRIHDQPSAMWWELLSRSKYRPDFLTREIHIFWPLKEVLEDPIFMWGVDVACGIVV
jgi:hypothetical protein